MAAAAWQRTRRTNNRNAIRRIGILERDMLPEPHAIRGGFHALEHTRADYNRCPGDHSDAGALHGLGRRRRARREEQARIYERGRALSTVGAAR